MKAFKKVQIAAGETTDVNLSLPVEDLAYYDARSGKWIVEPGKYRLLAGTSSKDILQSSVITVN